MRFLARSMNLARLDPLLNRWHFRLNSCNPQRFDHSLRMWVLLLQCGNGTNLRTSAVASAATDSGGRLKWRNGGRPGCGGDACVFCWRLLPDWVAREMPPRAAGHFSDGGRGPFNTWTHPVGTSRDCHPLAKHYVFVLRKSKSGKKKKPTLKPLDTPQPPSLRESNRWLE